MERLLPVKGSSAELQVVMSGSEVAIYVDGTVALSGRVYDLRCGSIGRCVSEGEATFSECQIHTRADGE